MARYTIELGTIVDMYAGTSLPLRERIEVARPFIFDFDYPFFKEEERKGFETRFIRHFYTKEIGFETDTLFKFKLETWLLIHAPYYNKLFASELLDFDPFLSYDLKIESNRNQLKSDTTNIIKTVNEEETIVNAKNETINQTGTNERTTSNESETESESNDTANAFNRNLVSNPSDNRLQIEINTPNGTAIDYAKEIKEDKGNQSTTNTSNAVLNETSNMTDEIENNTTTEGNETFNKGLTHTGNDNLNRNETDNETLDERRFGTIGVKTLSEMLNEYRSTFLRVEQQMFKEMNVLFMQIY